jgi:hypothetical protein
VYRCDLTTQYWPDKLVIRSYTYFFACDKGYCMIIDLVTVLVYFDCKPGYSSGKSVGTEQNYQKLNRQDKFSSEYQFTQFFESKNFSALYGSRCSHQRIGVGK